MHPPPSHAVCLFALQVGKPKRTESLVLPPEGLDEAIHALIGKQVGCNHQPACEAAVLACHALLPVTSTAACCHSVLSRPPPTTSRRPAALNTSSHLACLLCCAAGGGLPLHPRQEGAKRGSRRAAPAGA